MKEYIPIAAAGITALASIIVALINNRRSKGP